MSPRNEAYDPLDVAAEDRSAFLQRLAGSALNPAEKTQALADYEDARVQAARIDLFSKAAAARNEGNNLGGVAGAVAGVVSPAVSFLANRVNTGAFGLPKAGADALGGGYLAQKYDIPWHEAKKMASEVTGGLLQDSPVAAFAGSMSAFVSPTGPQALPGTAVSYFGKAKQAAGAALRATPGPAGVVASRVGTAAAGRLASAAADMAEASRTRSALLQLAAGASAAMAGAGVDEAIRGTVATGNPLEGAMRGLGQAVNPANIALGAASAAPAAVARLPVNNEISSTLGWASQKIKGLQSSIMETRPGTYFAGVLEQAKHSPYGRRFMDDWAKRNVYAPFSQSLDELRAAAGVGRNEQAAIGRAVSYTRQMPEILSGRLEAAKAELGPALDTEVSGDALSRLGQAVGVLDKKRAAMLGTRGSRAGFLTDAVDTLTALGQTSGGAGGASPAVRVTNQHLFNVMDGLDTHIQWAKTAFKQGVNMPDSYSAASVQEAKALRFALRRVLSDVAGVDGAVHKIREVRELQNQLAPLLKSVNTGTDFALFKTVLTAPDFSRRWQMMQRTLPAEAIDAFRGAYLVDFMEHVSLPRDHDLARFLDPNRITPEVAGRIRGSLFSSASVNNALSKDGMFSHGRFSAVLGQEALQDVIMRARVSDLFAGRGGSAGAEGSGTAGREAGREGLNALAGVFSNVLDAVRVFSQKSLVYAGATHALMGGRTATWLQRLASGEPIVPVPAARAAAFVNSQGGAVETLSNAAQAGVNAGMNALSIPLSLESQSAKLRGGAR